MTKKTTLLFVCVAVLAGIAGFSIHKACVEQRQEVVVEMVRSHAVAWETGNKELLASLLHSDTVFAYPGRRLNKLQTLEDLEFFKNNYIDTKVYIHNIVVDGDMVAVEWQFATTDKKTGQREVVSDAIVAKVKDGQFLIWKEYLDGRVKGLQAEGKLEFEEGSEPFPWPAKKQP
jgi:ketosteroid isomerase-like protein